MFRFESCLIDMRKLSVIQPNHVSSGHLALTAVMNLTLFYRDEAISLKPSPMLTSSMLDAWSAIPASIRAALMQAELPPSDGLTIRDSNESMTSSASSSSASDDGSKEKLGEFQEDCPQTGAKWVMRPLERAPENVFAFTKTSKNEQVCVEKNSVSTVTTKTTVVSTSRGWRNVFALPISYDVNIVPHATLLDPTNRQLLDSTGFHVEGNNRRFAVIDAAVDAIYGGKIRRYFAFFGIELTAVVIEGGEPAKRPEVCSFKSRFAQLKFAHLIKSLPGC